MKLRNKSAIITGAASGIGKEIALLFAREGANVAIADLNKDAAEAVAAEIRAQGGEASHVGRIAGDGRQLRRGLGGHDYTATAAAGASSMVWLGLRWRPAGISAHTRM